MKTKQKQKITKAHKVKIAALLAVVIAGIFAAKTYKNSLDTADVSKIRDLVIMAIDNLKTPAVVEPKTGDVYFPQAKLYLPASQNSLSQHLMYSYYKDEQTAKVEFSVTNRLIVGQLESRLYSAQNNKQLFEQIPHLQACSRGVTVSDVSIVEKGSNVKLRYSGKLQNGESLLLYSEDACSELTETVNLLKNLQSY